jgi:CBS domain containing-hemolysin-like protein
MLVPLEGGMWDADARTELDDVAEAIDPKLAEVDQDVDTLGGLAFVIAGKVPVAGDCLMHEASGWKIEIVEADTKRVSRVRLHPPIAREEDAAD